MTANTSRLERLLAFLASDPNNANLLRDAAEAALDANSVSDAQALLDRLATIAAPTERDQSLGGLAAMQAQNFARAREIFASLHEGNPSHSAIRFNLAWSLAMENESESALALLDEETVNEIPQAAMLQVQLMHAEELLEEAALAAHRLTERHPTHSGLLAAASVLAIDNEDFASAGGFAARAGEHPDALTTLGFLALKDDRTTDAGDLFARALEQNPAAPRVWIGAGLTEMLNGEYGAGAANISRGAEMFGTHVGSWIGAGWAYLVAGDLPRARRMFDQAMALDHTFAECHGSLAVLDVLEGDVEQARRGAQTASRLDGKSFSTALAFALLASADQQPDLAKRIIEQALHTPIDQSGQTIAQSIARLSLRS